MIRALPSTMSSAVHGFALCCIALGLLLRAIVPAGWMPAGGDGLLIILCTETGPVEAWLDADGRLQEKPADHKQAQNELCDFLSFSSTVLHLAVAGLTARPPALARILPFGLVETDIGRGLAAPPPPSTGPPTHL